MAVDAVKRKPKKPRPKAIIDTDGCTGCEVCMVVCPVDCISKVPGPIYSSVNPVCLVDEDTCTGCTICARECPWETIWMVYPDEEVIPEGAEFPTRVREPELESV